MFGDPFANCHRANGGSCQAGEARDLGLRRLNPGQEAAGVAILQFGNRVELVQGGAGVGKSASLTPVAHLVEAEGRSVFALAHAGRTARDFGQKIGAPAATVDSLLARHQRILDGTASPEQMDRARASLGGAVIMVDEASQIGTERLAKSIDLVNRMDVGRLVLAGDARQLQAIEAGKPFELLQKTGQPTSTSAENLRATSPQMQALNAALEQHDLPRAFDILRPDTIEVPFASGPAMAARLWVDLPTEQREETLLHVRPRHAQRRERHGAGSVLCAGRTERQGTVPDCARPGDDHPAIETVKPPSQDRANVPDRERVRERVPEREMVLDMNMDMGM